MKENQRTRLSKQMLRNSLIEILGEKSIHKVSIREICDRAEINRTTFYKYYGSQYDLLSDMEDEVLYRIGEYIGNDIDIKNSGTQIAKIILFINENINLFKVLINNNEDPTFPEKLFNLPMLKETVNMQLSEEYNESELEYIFTFVVNGGLSILKRWLNQENRESPEVIADIFNNIVRKAL